MVVWMSLKIGIFTEITSENLRYRTPQSDCFYNLTKIGYWHALRSKWDAPLSVPKKKKPQTTQTQLPHALWSCSWLEPLRASRPVAAQRVALASLPLASCCRSRFGVVEVRQKYVKSSRIFQISDHKAAAAAVHDRRE